MRGERSGGLYSNADISAQVCWEEEGSEPKRQGSVLDSTVTCGHKLQVVTKKNKVKDK